MSLCSVSFLPACFLQFNLKENMGEHVGLSVSYQDSLTMSMFTKGFSLKKAK